MKIKIKSVQSLFNGIFWVVNIDGIKTSYPDSAGAFTYAKKKIKRAEKEEKAFKMLLELSYNLLSFREKDLISKLGIYRCKGITQRQYGYLKGIHERQKREW